MDKNFSDSWKDMMEELLTKCDFSYSTFGGIRYNKTTSQDNTHVNPQEGDIIDVEFTIVEEKKPLSLM